jgi:ComF family protein
METNLFRDFLHLLYPPLCVGCSDVLLASEKFLCANCLDNLPKTSYHLYHDNRTFERLSTRFPLKKASSYLYYNKEGLGQKVVFEIKYHGNVRLGKWMGVCMANELLPSGFFDGIDFLAPAPLHRRKQRARGFNQSEVLADGISSVTGIPVCNSALYRKKANKTQTQKGAFERWKNVQGVFQTRNGVRLKNRHVLLIDDVVTTGSTLEACAAALSQCGCELSMLTLAIA